MKDGLLEKWRELLVRWRGGIRAADRPGNSESMGQGVPGPTWAGSAAAAPGASDESGPRGTTVGDDLTAIKGIGPAIARELRELGITRYRDLAAADPDELAARIPARWVTAEKARDWITAARRRAP